MANPFFNATYYLAQNPDVAAAVAGLPADQQFAIAEQHYDLHGAAEGRAPNAWFDAVAYLNQNPDLAAGGVTVATALAHYAAYGWNEGRTFNSDPALQPSNFDAANYATVNTDVATALGITDPSALTQEQQNQLLSHYLSHGIVEGRAGAGADFEQLINETGIVITGPLNDGHTWTGSVGNDLFLLDVSSYSGAPDLAGLKVNGVQGVDTLRITNADTAMTPTLMSIENISVAATAASGLTATGVSSLDVTSTLGAFTYNGNLVETLSVSTVDGFIGKFTNVAGAQDVLNVNLGAGDLTVNGVETVNATLGEAVGKFVITDNNVQGATLTINLDGGKAEVAQTVDLQSSGSGELASVVVNAADLASDLTITSIGTLQNAKSISVTTGAGEDTLNLTSVAAGATVTVNSGAGVDDITVDVSGATGAKVTIDAGAGDDTITVNAAVDSAVTVNGGAGNDTINGSDGTDTLTGGADADIFSFGADSALVHTTTVDSVTSLSGWDIVTDFKNVTANGVTEYAVVTDLTAVANGSLTGIGTATSGIITEWDTSFLANHTTLQSIVEALNGEVTVGGTGLAFSFGGNAYVWVQGGDADPAVFADDSLIQLTGVDASDLALNGGTHMVQFAV